MILRDISLIDGRNSAAKQVVSFNSQFGNVGVSADCDIFYLKTQIALRPVGASQTEALCHPYPLVSVI